MLTELVDRARRRFLWNEILAQGAWAVSAGMGALILLLLLGTQILEWYWLLLLPLATLAAGVWRTMRRVPSRYAVAQLIDARLGLSDTISTALYFSQPSRAAGVSSEVREAQRERAESFARGVDPRAAVPFSTPRAIYPMAALAVAATGLFAVRYGLEHRLDLQRPLASVIRQALGVEEQQLAALDRKQDPRQKPAEANRLPGLAINESNLPGEFQSAAASSLDNTDAAPAPAETGAPRQGNQDMQGLSLGEDSEGGEGEAAEGLESSEGEAGEAGQEGSANGQQKAAPNQNAGNPGSNSSLLAKFRDAMQNLMSRMRQQPAGGSGSQQQAAQGQNARQGQKAGSKQGGSQGQQQGAGQESAQDGQGQESQSAQNASGRGQSNGGEEQSTRQPGSGIGRQDGDKDVKLAEQLAAMGKLSEIIGKRSQNVSGEVTVEVQSNSQQLQTPYSRRSGTHGEAAAEIGRDEVPMALQAYVQQYFEQVRKQPAK